MGYAGGAAGGVAAAAAIANAVKAWGAIIRVEPRDFINIVTRAENPLIVMTDKSFWSGYKYLSSYKGLIFYTKSAEKLNLPGDAEIIAAQKIWIPS
ncbi:MAG: hypothetical protein JSU85_01185 [Candidatus Zixiibacteriota bacterium]|nr:MAG: hypothetical protein JSU85_01185 [candidate division Zixibacteria bacterium]